MKKKYKVLLSVILVVILAVVIGLAVFFSQKTKIDDAFLKTENIKITSETAKIIAPDIQEIDGSSYNGNIKLTVSQAISYKSTCVVKFNLKFDESVKITEDSKISIGQAITSGGSSASHTISEILPNGETNAVDVIAIVSCKNPNLDTFDVGKKVSLTVESVSIDGKDVFNDKFNSLVVEWQVENIGQTKDIAFDKDGFKGVCVISPFGAVVYPNDKSNVNANEKFVVNFADQTGDAINLAAIFSEQDLSVTEFNELKKLDDVDHIEIGDEIFK